MMKPYSSYKNTNIEWLEQIPNLWEVLPLKRVIDKFVDYRGHTPNKTDSGILLITARNIRDGHLDFDKSREYIAEEDYDSWMVRGMPKKGDVMVTTEAPLGAIAQIESENVALAQRLILLKANKNRMNNTFIKYYFLSQFGQNMLLSEGTGSTAIGIKASKFYNINIIIPPISEQQAIADFLDRKTAQIDTLIEKKQRQIDLLQEQRMALINHAVTKGLNPDVRMKDTGVEWLGEIPSHWEVSKIKNTCYVSDGNHGEEYPKEDDFTDELNGVPFIRAGDIDGIGISRKDMLYITKEKNNSMRKGGLQENDILLVNRGATIGKVALINSDLEGANLNSQIAYLRTDNQKISHKYLLYFLSSSYIVGLVASLVHGGALPQLPLKRIVDIEVLCPPKSEQEEIVKRLDNIRIKTEAITKNISEQISFIQEYRTALISEAVTGKIDVRTVHE